MLLWRRNDRAGADTYGNAGYGGDIDAGRGGNVEGYKSIEILIECPVLTIKALRKWIICSTDFPHHREGELNSNISLCLNPPPVFPHSAPMAGAHIIKQTLQYVSSICEGVGVRLSGDVIDASLAHSSLAAHYSIRG